MTKIMGESQNQAQDPKLSLDPAELEAEKEAMKDSSAEEVKATLIKKYGFDETEHAQILEGLAGEILGEKKKTSTAIRQKISWREKAQESAPKEQKNEDNPQKPSINADDIDKKIDAKVTERLDLAELDVSNLGDELKEEVKKYAKVSGVSVKEALKSPYIQFRKREADEKEKIENASIKRTNNIQVRTDFEGKTPAEVKEFLDLSTEEGRKQWTEYRKTLK